MLFEVVLCYSILVFGKKKKKDVHSEKIECDLIISNIRLIIFMYSIVNLSLI